MQKREEKKFVVTGPITGGKHGWPRLSYLGDISKIGYVEEEYFIEGEAATFHPQGEMTLDGKWTLRKEGGTPYKTRFLVQRPIDAKKFNGSVIIEWLNVSLGYETTMTHGTGTYENGFAIVYATVQNRGIHGEGLGLAQWDPQRYGSLHIANDWISYDIFTQIAQAVGPNRDTKQVDPMGGLQVKRLIANGYSHSGCSIVSYANGIQPIEHTFDAYLPTVCGLYTAFDDASNQEMLNRIQKGSSPKASPEERKQIFIGSLIRDDLDVPVFYINTEYETKTVKFSAQPDTERVRVWSVAGSPHLSRGPRYQDLYVSLRDGISQPEFIDRYVQVSYIAVMDAALVHLNRWIDEKIAPPIFPQIESDETGRVIRDEFGNAKGGIRLPELEVPIATYISEMGMTVQKPQTDMGINIPMPCYGGYQFDFSREKLAQLYKDHDEYVSKVTAAAQKAYKQGIILESRVKEYTEWAEAQPVPKQNVVYM